MLKEFMDVRQVNGEPKRRWFSDDFFDLIVWSDESGVITGFQLCYDKENRSRALTWTNKGYLHHGVSEGEDWIGKPKATPILVPDGAFDKAGIADVFVKASADIDQQVSQFVLEKLENIKNNS